MSAPPSRLKSKLAYFAVALSVFAADQLTKWLVTRSLPLYHSYVVVPRFFHITHVQNPGAAFSLFANLEHASLFLSIFNGLSLLVLFTMIWREIGFTRIGFGMSLIVGGAVGNLTDRLRLGGVVDFLAFDLGKYHWPDFNVADSCVLIGVCFVAFAIFFSPQKESSA